MCGQGNREQWYISSVYSTKSKIVESEETNCYVGVWQQEWAGQDGVLV